MSVPAEAASPAVASPAEACGNNYHEIDHHDLGSIATVHLLYNGTTNCVVTTKKVDRGKPTQVLAWLNSISPDGVGKTVGDISDYAYYAGPVRMTAAHTCISWGGGANPGWVSWYSKPSHCK
ncbi:hypothetical protein [Amycolatopsis viridis]|uniref:Serine/threonine protein kinase n=1 Tax=Amycolatopsis viridis TaxID=185678 RepID=A0ABX0SVF5_9PSEU|nr:hypothetical protein [Amycolatopsis viridis]NIH79480.1 hypothetical protein [Amycolatopsis viridis]